jgi:hypothetical protein
MQPEAKKLGVILIEAGLITPAQLQDTLRHQRLTGERLGSTLVAQGLITEDSLMDFLSRQTGVPRLDVRNLDIPPAVLQRIPRRLAEQMIILPVSFKEPKSLVLAMADPMDLNAIDSARFASGLNVQPVVAGHTALKHAITDHYNRLASLPRPAPVEVMISAPPSEALEVPLNVVVTPFEAANPIARHDFPMDPFFDPATKEEVTPFSFFTDAAEGTELPSEFPHPGIIHQRSAMSEAARPLETYGTRALILAMIRLFQRRGVIGQDELQRLLANLTESREIDPEK